MPTLKSREFECPDSMMVALVNLEIAKDKLTKLARMLRYQSGLFNTDVISAILDETADEIDTHTSSIDQIKYEMNDILSTLSKETR
jgi:hypothetical protein